MGSILSRLKASSPYHSVEMTRDGFTIIAKPEQIDTFTELVREAINDSGGMFAVFATLETGTMEGRYERAHIIPFE